MNAIETQKAEIEKLTADLAAAQELAEQANTSLLAVTAERDSAQTELASAKTSITTIEASVLEKDGLITARDTEIATLKADACSVEVKASRMLAAMGHEPLALTPDTDTAGGGQAKSLLNEFNSLKGAAQTEFWNKHKAQLIRENQKQGKP